MLNFQPASSFPRGAFRKMYPRGLQKSADMVVTEGIVHNLSFSAMTNNTRGLQDRKLVTYRRNAHEKCLAEVTDAQLPGKESMKDSQTRRVPKDFEESLHFFQVTGAG
jgi:hypothetical protein